MTLDRLIEQIAPLTKRCRTPDGHWLKVEEVILVHDAGPDRSDVVIRRLASELPYIRPVWLSRNFGQHAATLAGIASSASDWIVTLDEDGQFSPHDIPRLLDVAIVESAPLVYGMPTNAPPHGAIRNLASRAAKFLATRVLSDGSVVEYSSCRLILGEIGRGIAAYVGPGVYLEVALSWAFPKVGYCDVEFRETPGRQSGYSFRTLVSHFWRLVVSIGPRPLRIVSVLGVGTAICGVLLAIFLLVSRAMGYINVPGWTSLAVVILVIGGVNLLALGVIAEYVGAAVRMAMGKPLYMIISDPAKSALHRDEHVRSAVEHHFVND